MKYLFSIKMLFLVISIITVQIFIPVIKVDGLIIIPDILIIFLLYIGYYYGRFEATIIGFLFGFTQDLLTQFELIGVMSFIKSFIGYCLGTLTLYYSIWSRKFCMLYIFIIFFLHFYLYQFIRLNDISISILLFMEIIFIQTIISFTIFLIIDKYIIRNGILK